MTNAREIRLVINVDPSLIGGFLIKTESKVIDLERLSTRDLEDRIPFNKLMLADGRVVSER